jgi:hypothetical protein
MAACVRRQAPATGVAAHSEAKVLQAAADCLYEVENKVAIAARRSQDPPTVTVGWYNNRVLEVVWTGRVTGHEVSLALAEGRRLVGEDEAVPCILVDTDTVTGYELSVRAPSVAFLHFFKHRGLCEIVAVMPNPLVSMFASTMRLVTKVRFVVFKTRAEAIRYLAEQHPEGSGRT